MSRSPADATDQPQDDTSVQVRRALAGDTTSADWVVRRVSPLLLVQAEYRLGRSLRRAVDPEDLVNDVWLACLPNLGSLTPSGGSYSRAILAYLATALLHRIHRLQDRWIRERRTETTPGHETSAAGLSQLSADVTGAVSHAVREERKSEVWRQLQALDDKDREIIILRAIEAHPASEVGVVLGITENAVNVRYHRALSRLRSALVGSVFEELGDSEG